MGLDLCAENENSDCNLPGSIRVGSYGYVHVQRKLIIELAAQYLRNISAPKYLSCEDDEFDGCISLEDIIDAADTLTRWVKPDENRGTGYLFDNPVDYSIMRKTHEKIEDTLKHEGLYGVTVWCYHSDAEGYLSYGEICDVAQMLQLITADYVDDDNKLGYLRDFIVAAAAIKGTFIMFC